ncbi:MAG: SsrA-binding protein SmpB [Planctomycetaceae bacterium]|nr:SsrA-binding protein SmpB [Planctomycetaceae bacterium]
MAGKKSKTKKVVEDPNSRVVCRNRRARHNYEILDELQCGIELRGSEVKSIRNNKVSLEEAYARVTDGQVWLHGCDIAVYPQANVMNHEPRRVRKLLLKRSEIRKFAEGGTQQGLTLIPMKMYFNRGLVKVSLAIARGRKQHDKRQKLKQADDRRAMQAAMKRGG